MLWLSVANKDVYIIYCLLFTYSALSVTYLPPRRATVHALNRKSVKNKEFPVPLYWVSLVSVMVSVVYAKVYNFSWPYFAARNALLSSIDSVSCAVRGYVSVPSLILHGLVSVERVVSISWASCLWIPWDACLCTAISLWVEYHVDVAEGSANRYQVGKCR